ncbi:hypothetical protein [Pantoea sp. BAV 3049]|uniref:hypothetical protein n=1 Tax=Pantoea sp. BAV 3049 TaxID=2654188 RepID=UPI0018EF244C|nr:hypothetical protein [Pantoea sp. BAV 3049]
MRQFYDSFMKKAPVRTPFYNTFLKAQTPFALGFLPGLFIIVGSAFRTEGIPCE